MRLDIRQMVADSDDEYIIRNAADPGHRENFISGVSGISFLPAPTNVTRKVINARRWTLQGETRLIGQNGAVLQVGQKGDYLVEEGKSLKIYRKDEYDDYFG